MKEQYKRFKAWQLRAFDWSFDEHEHHRCVNCENDFVGNHCPYCSQKADHGKISWKSVLQGTAEVWGLHNRSLVYSLWQLMFRPGHFISDYINGKRQVSFPPVKMLIIMGVVSVIVDYLLLPPDATKAVGRTVASGAPLVLQFFDWLEASPGWGWLSITCFFLFPTWCLFHYAPRNPKHSLPQGFFVQVFMSIQVLIVDNLADIFGDFFYIMVPLCYLYTYRQLFGYRFWGNLWRTLTMLASGLMLAVLAIIVTEWLTIGTEKPHRIVWWVLLAVVPMLAGMLFSKIRSTRHKKT